MRQTKKVTDDSKISKDFYSNSFRATQLEL